MHDRVDRTGGRGAGLESVDLIELGVQRRRQGVGNLQDSGVRPSVDGQGEPLDQSTVEVGEVLTEAQDVGDRGAAPAVDRLVGISHRHHRVTVGEQPAQHERLSDRGVLIFVEEHDPIAGALGPAHDVVFLGQSRR